MRDMARKAKINRKTKETSIIVEANIDGSGSYKIDTKIGFLDHMLEQLSKHSLIDLKIAAKGDTHIDLHHTTEDTGIALGECLKKALRTSKGIRRDKAYRIVQKCAIKSLENNTSFYDSLLKDQIIMEKIPVNTLKKLFDFGYHTRKINVIFNRVLRKK